jgi:hypothetical protein
MFERSRECGIESKPDERTLGGEMNHPSPLAENASSSTRQIPELTSEMNQASEWHCANEEI